MLPAPEAVVVHPLVLLSVVDHYNRVAANTKKRVVGILLGSWQGKTVQAASCFAVPFEEDEKDPSVWFLDHDFADSMANLSKKVNAKEKPIGWYHTGPKLRNSDLIINDLVKKFCPNPVLVVVDVQPEKQGIPTEAYYAVEEVSKDGTCLSKTFAHVSSVIEAEEAEEIGVEHLLRDIKDIAVGTLASQITSKVSSLHSLHSFLEDISKYLTKVISGEYPANQQIIYALQDILNLIPNLSDPKIVHAFSVATNDSMALTYVSSLVRSIIAMDNLIDNKLANQALENAALAPSAANLVAAKSK